jgi:hypothetical protein
VIGHPEIPDDLLQPVKRFIPIFKTFGGRQIELVSEALGRNAPVKTCPETSGYKLTKFRFVVIPKQFKFKK